jgi:glutamate-1-semialdehyde 2,1-aminomutase
MRSVFPSPRSPSPSPALSAALGERLRAPVPGDAHTYAKGNDKYPEGAATVLVAGRGCRVRDADGPEFVEYGAGIRPVTLGHAEPQNIAAATRAMRGGTSFIRPTALEAEVAETFVDLIEVADMGRSAKTGPDGTDCHLPGRSVKCVFQLCA